MQPSVDTKDPTAVEKEVQAAYLDLFREADRLFREWRQQGISGAAVIDADTAVGRASAIVGHTLVWHNQTPSWVQNLDATSLQSALQNHIANVVGH